MHGNERRCGLFERFAQRATRAAGTTTAFIVAVVVVLVWAATGPLFHFSDTWQLVINTGTTVVTFLMVFLIQHTQNKDSVAIQLKLDEIVAAIPEASNRLIDAEDMDIAELEKLHRMHQQLANRVDERVGGERKANEEDEPRPGRERFAKRRPARG